MSEKLLQDSVDELFALNEQMQHAQQQFLQETTTLIKGSLKLLKEAQVAALKAESAASQSNAAMQQQREQAVTYTQELSFWRRFAFWVGIGYVAFGVLMALVVMLSGYWLAERQAAIDALKLPVPIVLTSKSKSYVVIKRDSQHALSLDDGSRVYVAEVVGAPRKPGD